MSFKTCKYYEQSIAQDHCPFSVVCDSNCYFNYQKLEDEVKRLNGELSEAYNEMQDMEDNEEELKDLQDEVYELQQSLEGIKEYTKIVISRLLNYEEVENAECDMFAPEWAHEINYFLINERRKRLMQSIKVVCKADKYLPEYANETDACMDLKIVVDDEAKPERWFDNMNYYSDSNECWLFPGEKRLFGTGIQVAVPENHVMLLYPRSSTGSKLNIMLANTTGVIDTGYRDEVKLCLVNYGDKAVKLEDGQRIAQFMIIPRPKLNLDIVEDNEEFRNGDRGGGFGSTGA
jgi:dUTP pyrophosphatase